MGVVVALLMQKGCKPSDAFLELLRRASPLIKEPVVYERLCRERQAIVDGVTVGEEKVQSVLSDQGVHRLVIRAYLAC